MNDFLNRIQPQSYALFRIVLGFLFLWHGMSKLFGFPDASGAPAFVTYVAVMYTVLGPAMLLIDHSAGMPWWWTVFEGPPIMLLGLLMLWLRRSLPQE